MKFNNKKLEKTSKFINFVIASVLCIFLILLSGKLMNDVGNWKKRPMLEDFQNAESISEHKAEIQDLDENINSELAKLSTVNNTLNVVNSNYDNAKKSFDNWILTRKAIGSPKEDKEVLSRAGELDEFYKTQQEWKKEISEIEKEVQVLRDKKNEFVQLINEENKLAKQKRIAAVRKYELKVFLIRLLFILPILLLGIYFIIKFRQHKYWPLFLGFVLFSFYSFFFGLVPYLPSYGGYVRYTVGIILSVLMGIYAINKIRAFIEHKKNELKVSTSIRAKQVQTETAEKALDNHMCPSCGKDFITKPWEKNSGKKVISASLGKVTNFCRFCGLELFKKCDKCDTKNFLHLPFCSNCGDKLSTETKEISIT